MILRDADATIAIGRAIGVQLTVGDVIALSGDLGAGKSTLARGVLAGLGFDGDVPSPTFPLVIPYEPPDVRLPVWHVDLYRLETAEDALELGLDEALVEGALLVEWPDRLGTTLPDEALCLSLTVDAGNGRRLTATVPPSWATRWP